MAISTEKLLKLSQFQTGLTAAKNYTDTQISAVQGLITTLNGKVTTLIGSDAGKSTRAIANEELAAQLIPAEAKDSLDTLQEIAAWIQSHPDDVAAINAAITAIETQLTGFDAASGSVKTYIDNKAAEAGISLTDLSIEITGAGNAITNGVYDNASGRFTFSKEATYLTENDISINVATDEEVTGVCNTVFGA